MGDLHAKYSNTSRPATTASRAEKINSPRKNLIQAEQSHSRASPSPQRAPKRMRYIPYCRGVEKALIRYSDDISVDKENEDIENPKKRVRGPPIPPARTTSRAKIQPSQVLSPRSANSRTLPRSPIRPASPAKSFLARPVSPLKPSAPVPSGGAAGILTNMVEKAKSTRAGAARKVTAEKPATIGAGRGKRTAPAASAPTVGRGRASTISESSESSNATIVRKPVPAPKKAPVKKSVMSTIKGMGSQKKMPAASKASAAPTAAGGRVLRKRN